MRDQNFENWWRDNDISFCLKELRNFLKIYKVHHANSSNFEDQKLWKEQIKQIENEISKIQFEILKRKP